MHLHPHTQFSTGGPTIEKKISDLKKTTNPELNNLLFFERVPVNSVVVIILNEILKLVAPIAGEPEIAWVHGTCKINPWALTPDKAAKLAHAKGIWLPMHPETSQQGNIGPVINITCSTSPLSAQQEAPGVEDVECTSNDSFQMWEVATYNKCFQNANNRESGCDKAPGRHTDVKESAFYIPRHVVTHEHPNLWPDYVVKAIPPPKFATLPAPQLQRHGNGVGLAKR